MVTDSISIREIKNISTLDVEFEYPDSNIIVVTGKNGIGKTSVVKAFRLIKEPGLFGKYSGEYSLRQGSSVEICIEGFQKFKFAYNERLKGMDTRDSLPADGDVFSELPIPYGDRFSRFSAISAQDTELKIRISTSDYGEAIDLIDFLRRVYSTDRFGELKQAKIKGDNYYFLLKEQDYYLREDHFSSGEYFLIQLYRIITSGAKLILIDEIDVALDGVAQANLYEVVKPLLQQYGARLIVISHSLAFMRTVEDGGLYYLESNEGNISLEKRSYGYIKSDLYGFRGFDRYILTEDNILEEFIEYIIRTGSVSVHYQYTTVGVNGYNQVLSIIQKNDTHQLFSSSENVLCIIDGDAFTEVEENYDGPTKILSSPYRDIELYVYQNRERLLSAVPLPEYVESRKAKSAAKTYWKYLTVDLEISQNDLFRILVADCEAGVADLVCKIQKFLSA
ncbi:AAA family ATPase [Teredinibacter turnerae]|uniref:AAA family ATPase n=1 Tax=Teredinibacter turnerae TaxID=2426 RepID=UPI0030D0A7FF